MNFLLHHHLAARDLGRAVAAAGSWFHRDPVFLHGESAARVALRRARDAPKMGLFAHIAWELCLDGVLLRRLGIERVLAEVRGSLAALRPDIHHRVAALRVRLPAADRAVFEPRVDRILAAIAAGPWVVGYATSRGVVERLEGLRMRLGFPALSTDDRDAVASGLELLAHEADRALDVITARDARVEYSGGHG